METVEVADVKPKDDRRPSSELSLSTPMSEETNVPTPSEQEQAETTNKVNFFMYSKDSWDCSNTGCLKLLDLQCKLKIHLNTLILFKSNYWLKQLKFLRSQKKINK